MRILASSDLHYNIKRSIEPTRDLARQVRRRGGDVLILAGDIAGIDETNFLEALELFADFKGEKLLVAGNHDLWVSPGDCSYEKWTNRLPKLARRMGFTMLDHETRVIGNIGFVGNVGWYDYTLRDHRLAIPLRFYQAKIGPGRALRVSEWQHLLPPEDELRPEHHDITFSWKDGEFVNLPMNDEEFLDLLKNRLQADLERISERSEKIVTILHHLPRRELVWYRDDANWDFATAFLGSQRLGDLLKTSPNLTLCLAGHNHRSDVVKEDGVEYITIGSTYLKKVLLEYDL
jgi:3',5'-cyclic AMP phosphodiesterase CpdA